MRESRLFDLLPALMPHEHSCACLDPRRSRLPPISSTPWAGQRKSPPSCKSSPRRSAMPRPRTVSPKHGAPDSPNWRSRRASRITSRSCAAISRRSVARRAANRRKQRRRKSKIRQRQRRTDMAKRVPPKGNVTPETFMEHYEAVSATKAAVDDANSAHRHALKAAKRDGLDQAMLLRAMSYARMDADKRDSQFRDLGRYLTWLQVPIGTQLGFDLAAQ